MKRSILEQVKVLPYAAGNAVDRGAFLSAVLAIDCASASGNATAEISLTHCDEKSGSFEALDDPRAVLGEQILKLEASKLINVDLDLIGCKRYVKIGVNIAGTASCQYALVLGDAANHPVE